MTAPTLTNYPKPTQPNSRAEWELEMEVFDMINNNPHPQRRNSSLREGANQKG